MRWTFMYGNFEFDVMVQIKNCIYTFIGYKDIETSIVRLFLPVMGIH